MAVTVVVAGGGVVVCHCAFVVAFSLLLLFICRCDSKIAAAVALGCSLFFVWFRDLPLKFNPFYDLNDRNFRRELKYSRERNDE